MTQDIRMLIELQIGRHDSELPTSIGQAVVLKLRRTMREIPLSFEAFVMYVLKEKLETNLDSIDRPMLYHWLHQNDILSEPLDGQKKFSKAKECIPASVLEVMQQCIEGEGNNLIIKDWIVKM